MLEKDRERERQREIEKGKHKHIGSVCMYVYAICVIDHITLVELLKVQKSTKIPHENAIKQI